MNIKRITAVTLVLAALFTTGCGKDEEKPVYQSENFTFTDDMALYMTSYTRLMLKDEMLAAGVDTKKPLDQQERSEGESWEDYVYEKTAESMEDILLYCEAALLDSYSPSEGMNYKADETLSYLSGIASENGITADEYVKKVYGDGVTIDSFKICTQMMALCEGYDLELTQSSDVTEEDARAFADENPDNVLKFDALRYTSKDKSVIDSLATASSRDEFLKIMSGVSGTNLTDSDKNGIPDSIEVREAVVATDNAGEFAKEDGRAAGDTHVTEDDGKYTVTMLLNIPKKKTEPIWNFRMIYLSTESSTDPAGDASSLLDQWKEKNGGEKGFSSLASRYSDDPTAYYGGLYAGITKEAMPSEAIASWVCDGARVNGDTTVIPASDGGAYMLYYVSGNIESWVQEAEYAMRAKLADEKISGIKEDVEKSFVLNEKLLRDIVERVLDEMVKTENEK